MSQTQKAIYLDLSNTELSNILRELPAAHDQYKDALDILLSRIASKSLEKKKDAAGAFEVLYHRYLRQFIRTDHQMLHTLGDTSVAAQVVHEKFLRIWKKNSYEPQRKGLALLYRIDRNICIDILRQQARMGTAVEPAKTSDSDIIDYDIWDYAMFIWNCSDPEIEKKTIGNQELVEKMDTVNAWLMKLSEKERSVLILWMRGYSYTEIAVMSHFTGNQIRGIMDRCKKRLRDEINGNIEE